MIVEIYTKKTAQYFCGLIDKDYFPYDDKELWHVRCQSYAGGSRIDSPLNVIEFKCEKIKELRNKINSFGKRGKYIVKYSS